MKLDWNDNKGVGVPCRFVLALLCFSGIALQYAMKVTLSVAIVAMVQSGGEDNRRSSDESDNCPTSHFTNSPNSANTEGEFPWDEQVQGHVLSSYFYGYLSSQLLGGYVAERFGGRFVCGFGVFLSGLLTLVAPVAARTHVYVLIAVRVLTGLTSGVVLPSIQSMITRWYPPREQSTFSTAIFSGLALGTPLGMALSGILVQSGGWPLAFYVFGSLTVLWFLPWLYYVHSTPSDHPRITSKEKEHILSQITSATLTGNVAISVPWISIFTSVPIWAHFFYNSSIAWFLYTMLTELPTYLKNILHFDVQQSGLISALPYLCSWVVSAGSGWVSQKFRDTGIFSHLTFCKIFNGICNLGVAACLVSIPLVGCNAIAILSLLVLSTVLKCFAYSGSYFSNLVLAPNFAGTIAGIDSTLANSLGVVAPLVVGALTKGNQTQGQWAKVFYIAAGVMCSSYVFYFLFGSMDEQSWNNPKGSAEDDGLTKSQDQTEKRAELSKVV